jgi:hypothetical protein
MSCALATNVLGAGTKPSGAPRRAALWLHRRARLTYPRQRHRHATKRPRLAPRSRRAARKRRASPARPSPRRRLRRQTRETTAPRRRRLQASDFLAAVPATNTSPHARAKGDTRTCAQVVVGELPHSGRDRVSQPRGLHHRQRELVRCLDLTVKSARDQDLFLVAHDRVVVHDGGVGGVRRRRDTRAASSPYISGSPLPLSPRTLFVSRPPSFVQMLRVFP